VSKSGIRRIILLTLGWEELPKSFSLYGDTSGERIREPVPAILLESDGGWVMLDTGLNPALIRDAPLNRRFHGKNHDIEPVLPGPGEPLEDALDAAGVAFDEVVTIALSHLHNDHVGGIRHFTGFGVPVHIQRKELDYGLSDHPGPEYHGMFRVNYDDPAIKWQIADGDVEIAPGLTAVCSPGHTPGHQSFVVDLDESVGGGGFVFAFDAADLSENIEQEIALGGYIDCTPEDTYPLIPGHDPVVWPALTEELSRRWL
jgi:glyoxylase-like metal-dependent hydrolase (beta-lactamase superfamily II)